MDIINSKNIKCSFDHAEADISDDKIQFFRCFNGEDCCSFFEEYYDLHFYDADKSKINVYLNVLEDVYIFKYQGYEYKILDKLEEKYKSLLFEERDEKDEPIPEWVWKYGINMIMKERRRLKDNKS